jgi:type II secretory pathway component PulJ
MIFDLKKRSVTLIELIVAMALTTGILVTLTFFYRQVVMIGVEMERTESENFNARYIESRLATILPKAVSKTDQKKDFLFFSVGDEGITKPGSQSLIFTFDRGVNLNKEFANHDLARLYLDNQGNVVMAYWPSPKRWDGDKPPMEKEVLLQGVDNMVFEFYIAPERQKKEEETENTEQSGTDTETASGENQEDQKKQAEKQKEKKADKPNSEEEKKAEPEPKGAWRKLPWLEEYNQLPVMVKIILTLSDEKQDPLIFVYPLPNAKSYVIYE